VRALYHLRLVRSRQLTVVARVHGQALHLLRSGPCGILCWRWKLGRPGPLQQDATGCCLQQHKLQLLSEETGKMAGLCSTARRCTSTVLDVPDSLGAGVCSPGAAALPAVTRYLNWSLKGGSLAQAVALIARVLVGQVAQMEHAGARVLLAGQLCQ
jgi:hypothetical protein